MIQCTENNGVSAVTSWLKSIRLMDLLKQMDAIDLKNSNAMTELKNLTLSVDELLNSNRGGDTGIHGFIGERAQVYLGNAWSLIRGNGKICVLTDDNGMTDYIENGIEIQQKACRSGHLGLDYMIQHRNKYPGFAGKYQMPKDFYAKYEQISSLSKDVAAKLNRSDWNFWQEIQKAKQAGIEIEPMKVTYSEIQRDTIHKTIDNHRDYLQAETDRQTEIAIDAHKPTIHACIKTAVISSAVEGILTGSARALTIRINGKRFRDFDNQDIREIGLATIEGAVKGAARGFVVYLAENLTPIPGVIAGGFVTVAFESGKAVKKYSEGSISKQECLSTIGKSVATASAGVLGAKLGGKLCPIPILGEVIGGFLFSFLADRGYDIILQLAGGTSEDAAPLAA